MNVSEQRPLREFVIVTLAEALGVGYCFDRDSWPAHVTVVGNSLTSADPEQIIAVIVGAHPVRRALRATLGAHDMFGRHADVPVLLAESPDAIELHRVLVDHLQRTISCSPREPAHWGAGFRPHVTLWPSVTARSGDTWIGRYLAVAELAGRAAVIHGEHELPSA